MIFFDQTFPRQNNHRFLREVLSNTNSFPARQVTRFPAHAKPKANTARLGQRVRGNAVVARLVPQRADLVHNAVALFLELLHLD